MRWCREPALLLDGDLPDLAGITVKVEDAEVTDEDVTEQIDALRERFATTTDVERPAADGDAERAGRPRLELRRAAQSLTRHERVHR